MPETVHGGFPFNKGPELQQSRRRCVCRLRAARPCINTCTKALPPNELQPREQAATMPTPWRRSQGHETTMRRNSAAQRITMLTAPTSKTSYTHPRPASMCAPRGGHRYKPRPGPRRHHLTHAAEMGQTSPQRRHQHKAPCIVPLPGAAAAAHDAPQTKATLPCINLRYMTGWLYFL